MNECTCTKCCKLHYNDEKPVRLQPNNRAQNTTTPTMYKFSLKEDDKHHIINEAAATHKISLPQVGTTIIIWKHRKLDVKNWMIFTATSMDTEEIHSEAKKQTFFSLPSQVDK